MAKNLFLVIMGLLVGVWLSALYFSRSSSLSANELFEKKKECARYKSDIENRIQKKCEEHKIENVEHMNCFLDEIYYNIQRNSCEYSRYWNYTTFKGWKINISKWRYYVQDYLSSKEIYSGICDKSDNECNTTIKSKIKELKWR